MGAWTKVACMEPSDHPAVRPVLMALTRVRAGTPDAERRRLDRAVARFAEQEGYCLADVFTVSDAMSYSVHLAELPETVRRLDARAVLMAWSPDDALAKTERARLLRAARSRCSVPVFTLGDDA